MTEYKNPKPIPVVVGLVLKSEREILTVQRAIPPFIGQYALPGGYMELGESWQDTLKREILEEACIEVSTAAEHMIQYDFRFTRNDTIILLFARIKPAGILKEHPFVRNREASDRRWATLDLYMPPQLCFPLHQAVVERHQSESITWGSQHPGGW